MVNYVKSELVKLKNTAILWNTLFFAIIAMLCKIMIFTSKTNIDINTRMNIQMSLMFMVIILNTTIVINRAYNSEKDANNFQNILDNKNSLKIWNLKLSLLSVVEIIAFTLAQLFGGFIVENLSFLGIIFATICIQVIISINLHMFLQLKFGDAVNILVGVIEMILVIFSTNVPMQKWYYIPCCYGYKIFEYFGSIDILDYFYVTIIIFISILLNIIYAPKIKCGG